MSTHHTTRPTSRQFIAPATDSTASWRRLARCDSYDVDIFFAPEVEGTVQEARRLAMAKRICRECPVMMSCRAEALQRHEPHGVWGGLSERDRRSFTWPLTSTS